MDRRIDDAIGALWDFNNPRQTEAAFADAVARARAEGDPARSLALMTQQARALGLQQRCAEAETILDEVERSLADRSGAAMLSVQVRLLLERGRLLNSSGSTDEARRFFERAWEEAVNIAHDALAIDAAHMVAITCGTSDKAIEWNRRAVELADSSEESLARRWRGSLHNNLGWTFHDRGEYATALRHFEMALEVRRGQRQQRETLIAHWCIGRCLRSMGRIEEALAAQMHLLEQWRSAGERDGFVLEEIGECLLALGRPEQAKAYFAEACDLLTTEPSIEPERLQRLADLAQR